MERPKGEVEPRVRAVTGEVMYLDEARRLGSDPKQWPDDLSDMAIQLYEEEAAIANDRDWRPPILDEYESYDREIDELSASCAALAEELLKLKEPDSQWTFETFVIEEAPQEVLEKLKQTRVGEVLAGDDEQLAIPSNGEYYPVLDIKKQDMKLAGVSLRVFGWSDRKYIFTNKPGEQYQYPQNCLVYPSDEKSKWYSLELTFAYDHPEAGAVNEEVQLSIGQRGDLSIHRQIWASPYAETGYEGHLGKGLEDTTDEDIAAFADLVAEIVGDEPEAVWHRNERVLAAYIDTVPSETARKYLGEWLTNMHASQILGDLQYTAVGDKRLAYALKHDELAKQGLEVLAAKVGEHRARRNELAADKKRSMEWFGRETEPWHDVVDRQAQS